MAPWASFLASAAAFGLGAAAAFYVAGPALGAGPMAELSVSAKAVPLNPDDPRVDRVGRLAWRGGLVLDAADIRFGGLSGLLWEAGCNRLIAVSDSGSWVILEPAESKGRLTGISAAWIAPVRTPEGTIPVSKGEADAEALARSKTGAWVFYEQRHRAEHFTGISACKPESLATIPDRGWTPPDSAGWPGNGGLEAAGALADRIIVVTELVPGAAGGRLGLSLGPNGKSLSFSWMSPPGHQPTALVAADRAGSSVLVLHRRFSPLFGVSIILGEATVGDPPEAVITPREIARLRAPLTVDNMEALAVRVEGERRYIYMLSDNNFNAVQRTLLLKFELLPEPAP